MTDDAIRLDAHKDEFHRDQQWHKPVRVAATGNVTIATGLNAGDTIDGETLAAGDRVLLPAQSTASQNGIYVVRASPGRAYDMLTGLQVMGSFVYVIDGTANGGKLFRNTNLTMPTVGSTSLTFEEFQAGGSGLDVGIALFQDHGTVGATEDIDQSAAMAHWITLDVNCTLTFSGAVSTVDGDPVECSFRLYVEQDGSGGNTITWPGSVEWPGGVTPTLDTTAGSVEILDFTTPDGGTTWFGFHGGTSDLTLSDDTPLIESGSGDAGVSTEASRSDHVHPEFSSGGGGIGEILISDTPSTPLVFADLIQNEAQDDLVYADP